jgi:hypothetical protein
MCEMFMGCYLNPWSEHERIFANHSWLSETAANPMSETLVFPEFFENTVVLERKLVERWGAHRG